MSGFTEAQLTDWKEAAEEMVNGEIVERLIAEIERLRGARTVGYAAGILAGRQQAKAVCKARAAMWYGKAKRSLLGGGEPGQALLREKTEADKCGAAIDALPAP